MARRGAKYLNLFYNAGEISNSLAPEIHDKFKINGFTSSLYALALDGWSLSVKQDSRWTSNIKFTLHHKSNSFSVKVIDNLPLLDGRSSEEVKDLLLEHLMKCLVNCYGFDQIEKTSLRLTANQRHLFKVEKVTKVQTVEVVKEQPLTDFTEEQLLAELVRRVDAKPKAKKKPKPVPPDNVILFAKIKKQMSEEQLTINEEVA